MTPLSVVIITFNEEKNIGNCLASVKDVADEIVVVDSFSVDNTKQICEKYGARVIQKEFGGFIEQKNLAVSLATYPNILSLDADECLSVELKQSIQSLKSNWQYDGYVVNRLTSFCGRWVRHSGWYPDRKLRLFIRDQGVFRGTNPHDRFELHAGSTLGRIRGDLLHYTAESEADFRAKMERYATIAAAEMHRQKRTISLPLLYLKTVAAFFRNYVIRLGFLDGIIGWKVCTISAGYTFQKYAKLRVLNKENRLE